MSVGDRPVGGRLPAPVALTATTVLAEGLRNALEGHHFEVLPEPPSVELANERPGLLMVCEVHEASEDLARTLLALAPHSPLVFIGPTGSELAANRPNVRELSADVSVAEVVRVCELIAFGDASAEQWITPVSQPSLPYNVLPRVSDPPLSAHSIPAPLLPSSVPPTSSRPASGRRSQTLVPPVDPAFADEPHASFTREVSPELSRLLAEAETRVARNSLPRRSASDSASPEPLLALSAEVLAALEDPIGDYELSHAVLEDKAEPLPVPISLPGPALSLRGQTDVTSPSADDVNTDQPPSALHTQTTGVGLQPSPKPPSVRTPSTRRPSTAPPSYAAFSPQPQSGGEPSVIARAAPSEPTTAPPPRSNDERVTARPSRRLSPIPPAPAIPRGSWLSPSLPDANPQSWREPSPPTPLPPSAEPSSLNHARELPTAEPPAAEPSPEPGTVGERSPHFARELPPLGRGDAIGVLATAVRSRYTGAIAFEAEGGVRRVVLRDGDFSTAASGLRSESLLAFLVSRGNLSPEVEAQLAHKVPSLGRHAGAALVAAGHLAQDQLWNVLRGHAEFIIGRIALSESGMAGFEEEVPARLRAEPAVFGGATGSEILIETLRRVIEPKEAVKRLGGADAHLSPGEHFDLLDECALPFEERTLLETLQDLPVSGALGRVAGPEFACVLYALTELQVLRARKVAVAAPLGSGSAKQPRDRLDDAAMRRSVLARKALIEHGDYFAVLGIGRDATGYDVKAAYLNLRKQLDPSRVLTPSTLDLKEDLELILEVLSEAYSILSDQLQRDRYRRAIESVPDR